MLLERLQRRNIPQSPPTLAQSHAHNLLPLSLFNPSLNTYPTATGLPQPLLLPSPFPAPTPFGAFFSLSVKNTGCLTDASYRAPLMP
jgi:hypothetical protein